jgi:hypothetical protein
VSGGRGEWSARRPALVPSTGFDARGVWVGNWITALGPPALLCSGVNGEWVGLGVSRANKDGSFAERITAAASTPRTHEDRRDPFVLQTGDGWLALIGAGARDARRALVYLWRSPDGTTWEPESEFDTGRAQPLGIYWQPPMLIPVGDRWALFATPVRPDLPARTEYGIGSFDGTWLCPDDPTPRQYDMLATLRAPTVAARPDRTLVAVNIIADELRDEPARHASGCVHVLGLAKTLDLCPGDGLRLCAALAAAQRRGFERSLELPQIGPGRQIDSAGLPTSIRATTVTEGEGAVEIASHSDGTVGGATLSPDLLVGAASLDYADGPLMPKLRPASIQGQIPIQKTTDIILIIDGAAVSGTVNGQPFGFLVFSDDAQHDKLSIEPSGGARVQQITAHHRG